MIIITTILKSMQSCAAHVHVEISHANDYHVNEQIYTITIHVVNFFYTITCHTCLNFSIIHLFVYYMYIF